jgi:hypothetical protein
LGVFYLHETFWLSELTDEITFPFI